MLAAGSRLGRYRIERELGAGGMGHVYAAEDTLLRRTVALKIVRRPRDDGDGDVDGDMSRELAARLLREARAAAALHHPNAISIYDVGESDGVAFIAMELVVGQTLGGFVGEGAAATVRQKVEWLLGIARALAAAHAVGIIHRDVKPDNIMVCPDGSVKVLDFGIAKRAGPSAAGPRSSSPPSFASAVGTVTGTPRYMAPEQLSGGVLDGATDQLAWGIVAYELLSGVHPQSTTGTAERWGAPPKALAAIAPAIETALSTIVMRTLERWPEYRWRSMEDLVRALEKHAGLPPAAPAFASSPRPEAEAAPTMQLGEKRKEASEAVTGAMAGDAITGDATAGDATAGGATAGGATAGGAMAGGATAGGDAVTGAVARAPVVARSVTPSCTIAARVSDPSRPTWRRLAVPLAGLAFAFAGLAVMLIAVVVIQPDNAPDSSAWLIRGGWILIFIAPLTALARAPRAATLEARAGRVVIRNARGMNQSLVPSMIAGMSAARSGEGDRFTVLVMPKRGGTLPLTIDVADEDAAHALRTALGMVRAVSGTITWPVRAGAFDAVRLGVAITWRVAIVLTYVPVPLVYLTAFAITVLSGVLALGLAFAPPTGPHVELTDEQVRVFGRARRIPAEGAPVVLDDGTTIALRDITRVSATADEIALVLRSGDTIAVAAPIAQTSRRGLTSVERAQLVAHVRAAADRARAAWS